MRINAGVRFVPANDLHEAVDVIAEFFRSDRGILDEGKRFGVFLHGHGEAERCLPQIPYPSLLGRLECVEEPASVAVTSQVLFTSFQARRELGGGVAVELDTKDRPRAALDKRLA